MVKKIISRKRFITTVVSGVAAIALPEGELRAAAPGKSELRTIGSTGLSVSSLCFGAPRTNEESLIKFAVEKGMNFIDTGRSYGNGNNEKLVGRAISGMRTRIVIQSKIRLEANELPSGGKGRKGADEIKTALSTKLEASLKALNTEYIDVLFYHDAIDENLLFHTEVLKFFSDMKSSGVIRAHGFSTHNERMNLPHRNNSERFYDIIMVPFNHKGSFIHSVSGRHSDWDQERLVSILAEAERKGIGVIAMKTCSAGKYSPGPGVVPSFREAVGWVLRHKFVSSAAVAMADFEQVNDHISLI